MNENSRLSKLASELATFKSSDEPTDLEINYDGKTWKVHRAVLALHFPHHSRRDAVARGVELRLSNDHKLFDLDNFVDFLYTLEYTVRKTATGAATAEEARAQKGPTATFSSSPPIDVEAAASHVRMWDMGKWHGMSSLCDLAHKKFNEGVGRLGIDDAGRPPRGCKGLIKLAYETGGGPSCFRRSIVEKLIDTDSLRAESVTRGLGGLMRTYPAFAVEIVTHLARRSGVRKNKRHGERADGEYVYEDHYECEACSATFWAPIPDDAKQEAEMACPECGHNPFPECDWGHGPLHWL